MLKKLKEYTGVIHIHTNYSDGFVKLKTIAKIANKIGLDYVIITDHNDFSHYLEGSEGWYGRSLISIGKEITLKTGHCLAIDINRQIQYNGNNLQHYIDQINKQNGMSFIAHPHLSDRIEFKIKKCSWTDWTVKDFTGIEVWSYMHDWIDKTNIFNFVYNIFKPDKLIDGPFKETIKKWDELCQTRKVVGIGGLDAHSIPILPIFNLKVFPYKDLFQKVRTHILSEPFTNNFTEDKKIIMKSIRNGHCFFANDYESDSSGFGFWLENDKNDILAIMGDEVKFCLNSIIKIKSPIHSEIRLIKDGKKIFFLHNNYCEYKVDEYGVYRVEVRHNNRKWIYSNPIYIRK